MKINNVKYNTEKIESCEYIQRMLQTYSKKPEVINGKCTGYKNPYNKKFSTICQKCQNFEEVKE